MLLGVFASLFLVIILISIAMIGLMILDKIKAVGLVFYLPQKLKNLMLNL